MSGMPCVNGGERKLTDIITTEKKEEGEGKKKEKKAVTLWFNSSHPRSLLGYLRRGDALT